MFRCCMLSAVLLSTFAVQAVAQNSSGAARQSVNADKNATHTGAKSSADAPLADVVVEGVQENPADKPYRVSGSTAYLSESDVERFRGTSMGDFLSGIPGVLNGDGRNAAAMDVNIRGMQGQGRVPVIVDGASQETTIWHGYAGATARSYIDPDLIAEVDIEKGGSSGADATGASGGVVRINTLAAKDILLPERRFGIRIKGGMNTNSRKTPPGTLGGGLYQRLSRPGPNLPESAFYPARGVDRPALLKPTGFHGSIAAAYAGEHIELLAAYARRSNGNYFSGKHGGGKNLVSKFYRYDEQGKPLYDYSHTNPSYYRPGEEILNTSQDNRSYLLKSALKWGRQRLELGWNRYQSDYGQIMGSWIGRGGMAAHQNALSTIDMDTYTAQYRWQSDSPWWDIKANAFINRVDNRISTYYSNTKHKFPWDRYSFPYEHGGGLRSNGEFFWMQSERKGITLSNRMQLGKPFSVEYGAAWTHEKMRPSDALPTDLLPMQQGARNGWRREYSLFANVYWQPHPQWQIDSGLRWQRYTSQDNDTRREDYSKTPVVSYVQPVKSTDRGWSPHLTLTWRPDSHWRVYAKYAQTTRAPSLFENLSGFSIYAPPEGNPVLPERARNLELGAAYIKQGVWQERDTLRFHAAVFDNRIKDYITRAHILRKRHGSVGSVLGRVNLDYAHMRGGELSLDYDGGSWFAGVAWSHYFSTMFCLKADAYVAAGENRCQAGGIARSYALNQIPPRDEISLNAGVRLFARKLLLGGRYRHVSKPVATEEYVPSGASGVVPASWKPHNLLDLYGSYQIGKQAEINFAIDNVGDRHYIDPLRIGVQPAPGRTVRMGFSAKF